MLFEVALAVTAPNLQRLPPLQNGDIVFRTNISMGDLPIALASQSLITHVGIIQITPQGALSVIGAEKTVSEVPFASWVNHGGRRLLIARVKNLTDKKAAQVLDWAKAQDGKPYDFFYLPDETHFYCSELVYDAYKKGAGISLGQMQVVGELPHVNSAPVQNIIRQRWRYDPLCLNGKGQLDKDMTFETCRARIMKQTLITPASIARDPQLDVIYSNYP